MRCDWMEAAKIVREWGTGLGVVPSWAQLSLTYQSSELPGCCCPWEPIHFQYTEKFSPMASREVPASPLIQSAFEQCAPLACLQLYIDSKSIESSEPKERKRMMKSPPAPIIKQPQILTLSSFRLWLWITKMEKEICQNLTAGIENEGRTFLCWTSEHIH